MNLFLFICFPVLTFSFSIPVPDLVPFNTTVLQKSFTNITSPPVLTFVPGIPCASVYPTCVCPGKCLYPIHNQTCQPLDCWKWDTVKELCVEDGPSFTPAVVLQAIPFTGIVGAGFGNMGRWDLFGIAMGSIVGGIALVCCTALVLAMIHDEVSEGSQLVITCFGCILVVWICTYWIWGLVGIANKTLDGPIENWEGKTIMCSLS